MTDTPDNATAPVADDTPAPIAAEAAGPVYDQFCRELSLKGFPLALIATPDFNGRACAVRDLNVLRGVTTVPLSLTVANERYYAHPVLTVREIP